LVMRPSAASSWKLALLRWKRVGEDELKM
jgi:hypothetical protein